MCGGLWPSSDWRASDLPWLRSSRVHSRDVQADGLGTGITDQDGDPVPPTPTIRSGALLPPGLGPVDPTRRARRPTRSGQWNRCIYVGNDPIHYIDPTGMFSAGCFMHEFIGIGWVDSTSAHAVDRRMQWTFNPTAFAGNIVPWTMEKSLIANAFGWAASAAKLFRGLSAGYSIWSAGRAVRTCW